MEYCCLKRILKRGTAESKDSLMDKNAKQKRANDDNIEDLKCGLESMNLIIAF